MLEPLFNKVAGLKAYNFIKKSPQPKCSCEYCEIFKNSFFIEHLWWLLLVSISLKVIFTAVIVIDVAVADD